MNTITFEDLLPRDILLDANNIQYFVNHSRTNIKTSIGVDIPIEFIDGRGYECSDFRSSFFFKEDFHNLLVERDGKIYEIE